MAQFDGIRFQPSRPLLKELSADRLNTILAEIRKNRPRGERGITVRQTGDGAMIGLAATPKGGGSTPATRQPWDLIASADPDNENQYLVTVHPGTINGVLPSNHFDGASLREFAYSANQLNYVIVTATTNGKEITAASLSLETAAPPAQTATLFALPTEVKITIGLVYNTNAFQIENSSIFLTGTVAVSTERSGAAPGELPFNAYYVWSK
jgi:hypothetical protein